jgi:hypothetical protein
MFKDIKQILCRLLVDMSLYFDLAPLYCVFSTEAANTNYIVCGLTQQL